MPTKLMESLYQMNILEQNINYKILEGMYEEKKSTVLNEAKENKFLTFVKFIGKQLQEFWKMIKTWWGRFVEFVTKTVPSALRKGFDKLLTILKIKEDSIVDVNVKGCSEEETKNIKKAAATINRETKKSFLSKVKGIFHKEEKDGFDISGETKDIMDKINNTQQQVNAEADKAMESINKALENVPADKAATLKEAFKKHKMVYITIGANTTHFNGPLMDIEKINESVDTLQEQVLVKMSVEAKDLIKEINDVLITISTEKITELSEMKVMSYQERKDDLLKYKKIYTIEQLNQDKPVKAMTGAQLGKIFNYAQQSADQIKKNAKPVQDDIKDIQDTLTRIEKGPSKVEDAKPAVSKLISVTNTYLNGITACTNDMVAYFTAFQKDLLRYEVENRNSTIKEAENK